MATAKFYQGDRLPGRCVVRVNGEPLKPRNDVWNHSPDGFEWGYGGSGPAQLALAILCDYLNNPKLASRLHQLFKSDIIVDLPHTSWELTGDAVQRWLESPAIAERYKGLLADAAYEERIDREIVELEQMESDWEAKHGRQRQ